MASYDITTEVNEMLALGVTKATIVAAGRVSHIGAAWSADNRGTHYAIQSMLADARRTATRTATSRPAAPARPIGSSDLAQMTEALKARRAAASHGVRGEIWDN